MINGNRVRQAREISGWTQTELAHRVGIKQPTLAQIERGSDKASADVVEAVAHHTECRVSFFELADTIEFPMGSLLFRAHAAATSRQKTEAYRHAQLIFEIRERLAETATELEIRLPRLKESPLLAARIARAELGLSPNTPVAHLINVLERNGVVVLGLPVDAEKRDAFSLWAGSELRKPVIALCSGRTGDRVYWNTAHELAHLILHQPTYGTVESLEQQANLFAAEFLLPEAAMREEIAPPFSLETFAKLKPRWNVAMQALIRRAFELNIIPERTYRYLFEQIGWNGWRKREPPELDVPLEKPRALKKMAEITYGKPIDVDRLAFDSHVTAKRISQILSVHADQPGQQPIKSVVTINWRNLSNRSKVISFSSGLIKRPAG
jgi:Zn-dependent peptidase ImmA (M78 family)/DNA-binding XRE family transcriptional regulator